MFSEEKSGVSEGISGVSEGIVNSCYLLFLKKWYVAPLSHGRINDDRPAKKLKRRLRSIAH